MVGGYTVLSIGHIECNALSALSLFVNSARLCELFGPGLGNRVDQQGYYETVLF